MRFSGVLVVVLLLAPLATLDGAGAVYPQEFVSPSDLLYDRPAATPAAGQPVGNGRMGTMVWTSPDAIYLQINRVDVFAVNCDHQGQPGQRGSATDYCGGIASVVVHVGGQPFAPSEKAFRQRLSLHDAECAIEGRGLHVRCFVSAVSDLLVLEIDDRRAAPERLKVTVSMLRKPEVRAGENIATSTFSEDPSRIVLTQRFRERDYYNASAVAVAVAGGGGPEIDRTSPTSRMLVLPATQGKRVILISSVAAWNPESDVAGAAVALVNEAGARSVAELRDRHQAWWHEFSPRPGEAEIICVFPAWPTEWDASFRLLARGGFLVSSEIKEGKVAFVEIESRLGEDCRLRNPWGGRCSIREASGILQALQGEILVFPTVRGRKYCLRPQSKN